MIALLREQGYVRNIEVRSVKKDGTRYWVSISAVLLKDSGSKPAFILGSVTDITERKNAEDILQENEKRWRTLIEKSADALTLLKSDGTVIYEGPTVQRLTGYSAEERVGQNSLGHIFPADLPMVKSVLGKVLSTPGNSETAQFRSVRKDGSAWWVEATATNLLEDPSVQAIVVNYRDITARKQAEDELRDSENRFRILFEHAGMGVAQADSVTGQFLRVNQRYCEIVGYTAQELEKKNFHDITHPDDLPDDLEYMERLRSGEVSEFMLEKRYCRKDGSIVWVLLVVSPLWGPGEPPGTHIGVIHDITEQKRAENALRNSEAEVRKLNAELERRVVERTSQLEATNKELEAFAYSISHDLRAPLRAIDGFARILEDDYAEKLDEDGKFLIERLRSANRNLTQLVDALLGLSRMTRAELRHETVDLSAIARSVLETLQQNSPAREVIFHVAEGLKVQGDYRLMRVVLENLIGNAWKFTTRREHAAIEFGTIPYEDDVAYFVRDNGAGFNMAYADKLFGAFQRLHASTEFEGTGIGLATVQRIIHRHGGRVWAEGEMEKGATFYFTLGQTSA
jgi:PAS domain S-box-containing protein